MKQLLFIFFGIAAFVAILHKEVRGDYKKWLKNIKIKHKLKPLIRGLMLLPSMLAFLIACGMPITFWNSIIVGLMIAFNWWLFFDGFYALKRDEGFFYNGGHELEEDDSLLDLFLDTLTTRQKAFLKIGLAIICNTIYLSTL